MHTHFGIICQVLNWISQICYSFVNIREEHINKRLLNYCIPTGSLLGPIAIIPSYIRKISQIADKASCRYICMGMKRNFTYTVHKNNDTINENVTNIAINIYQGNKRLDCRKFISKCLQNQIYCDPCQMRTTWKAILYIYLVKMERSNIVLSLRVTIDLINVKYNEDTFIGIISEKHRITVNLIFQNSKFHCTNLYNDLVHVSK